MKLSLRCLFRLFAVVLLLDAACCAAPIEIPLWPNGPAEANGLSGPEIAGACTGNISEATLTVHLPPADKATGGAIVILPGGGYRVVCEDTEGEQIAALLLPHGIAAIVLKYRLPNGRHQIPATDARRALRLVRHSHREWRIDPSRVGIWAFSAGGHLGSTLSNAFDEGRPDASDPVERHSCRPDFSMLFYPVISMDESITHPGSRALLLGPDPTPELVQRYSNDLRVSDQTPPTFLLHAADDQLVPLEHSLRYYRALKRHGVPARLVAFESGGHGPNAFKENPSWWATCREWLQRQGCL